MVDDNRLCEHGKSWECWYSEIFWKIEAGSSRWVPPHSIFYSEELPWVLGGAAEQNELNPIHLDMVSISTPLGVCRFCSAPTPRLVGTWSRTNTTLAQPFLSSLSTKNQFFSEDQHSHIPSHLQNSSAVTTVLAEPFYGIYNKNSRAGWTPDTANGHQYWAISLQRALKTAKYEISRLAEPIAYTQRLLRHSLSF